MGQGTSKADLADILTTLSQTDVSPDAHDFWDELWKLNTTPEDIFELIPPDDVRQLKKERPDNLVTLFTQAVAQLCQIVHTPVPMYFGQALNCVRILTRVLPFLLESDLRGEDAFVERLCWSVDEDEDDDEPSEPLARLIVHATLHLLFLPGFSVDATAFDDEEEGNDVPQSALWAPGLGGFEANPAQASAFDRNRVEVLRLLLSAICEPLYLSAEAYDPWASRWLSVATARDLPNARLLFYSLLNVVFSYDPTGFGLPYGGALASEAPTHLVTVAAQVVIALLDYGEPATGNNGSSGEEEKTAASEEENETTAKRTNVFREMLAELSGAEAYEFAFEGLARLLNNVHESQNTTLPGSLQQIECYQEVLVLLWKLLEENPGFMPYVLRHCDVTRLAVPVCFLQYQARRDPARVGLVHICTFIVLKLSGERQFCVALNKPFTESLPIDLPLFYGSHADLVVITLHKLVVNGGDKLSALYNCFLTIMCNLSPYVKTLSLVSSVKLVNLFELFTSPRFLYQAETNHVYVSLLLEIFNNVIQYQYGGNPHLVYAVLRRRVVFEQLDNLTLPTAIANSKKTSLVALAQNGGPVADQVVVATKEEERIETPDDASSDAEAARRDAPDANSAREEKDEATHDDVDATVEQEVETEADAADETDRATTTKKEATILRRFTPTEEWLARVKAELPLNTITRLLQHLGPQLDELVGASEYTVEESQILDFIKNTTMVGLLPVPHAIVIRKYQPNSFTSLWFSAFLWGCLFLGNQLLPLFDGSTIKLFTVSVVT